jgi:galactosamine-6-phosphate isomerase
MQRKIYPDHEAMSQAAAEYILQAIRKNPEALICVSTGDTPTRTYQLLCEMVQATRTDVSRFMLIALDEWAGISPDNTGSCYWYLHHYLIDPLNLKPNQVRLFDAQAFDLEAECRKTDDVIRVHGGIDLVVAGVGMNGHIGFNEPGTPVDRMCHVSELEEITRVVGQKYFQDAMPLRYGITVGLKPILESKTLMLLASGAKKAPVMKEALQGISSNQLPASLVQQHPNGVVMLDEGAASLLNRM